MNRIEKIKGEQNIELNEICTKTGASIISIENMLKSEKIKKLYKRNHYIQQTIDKEIENNLSNNYEN